MAPGTLKETERALALPEADPGFDLVRLEAANTIVVACGEVINIGAASDDGGRRRSLSPPVFCVLSHGRQRCRIDYEPSLGASVTAWGSGARAPRPDNAA
jgi:hypothetical protein